MAERKRVMKNTVQGAVEQYKAVSQKLQPKTKLNDLELTRFNDIVSSAEVSVWNDNRLFNATMLARIQVRLEKAQERLDAEGETLVNERGTQISNPLFNVMIQLTSALMSLNRTLGLTAPQQGVSGAAQEERNKADARARGVIEKAKNDEDNLLA
jgi:hypothetical protein